MRLLKAGLVQLLLLSTLGLASVASAPAALPDAHLLPGEEYPMKGEGAINGPFQGEVIGKLETELGEKLTFAEMKISMELLELSSLGPDTLVLTGVVEPKSKASCSTAGSPEGTVTIPGEYHVVNGLDLIKETLASLLILFKELLVECNKGKLKVKVRSPWLARLHVIAGTDESFAGLTAKCSKKGRQEMTEYLNDEERAVKGQLTANFALGFETACMELTLEMTVTLFKMVDFLF
jgi:hypothetical protein